MKKTVATIMVGCMLALTACGKVGLTVQYPSPQTGDTEVKDSSDNESVVPEDIRESVTQNEVDVTEDATEGDDTEDTQLNLEEEIPPLPAMKTPVGDEAVRTMMIYMVGSDLESGNGKHPGGYGTKDIIEMLEADTPDRTNVIVQCGGSKDWKNKVVPDGEVTRFSIQDGTITTLQKMGKSTMSNEGDLCDFIRFASENFPAANYSLVLWDHGGGTPIQFGLDELGNKYRFSNGETMGLMYDYDIKKELDNANVDFDMVIFDACNMCTLEMAKCLKDHADYMVGAESKVAGIGVYYTNMLGLLDRHPLDICERVARDYMREIHETKAIGSMSAIRLDIIDEVYEKYTDYIASLTQIVEKPDGYAEFCKARSNCMSADEYDGMDSIDLMTLANNFETNKSTPLINKVVCSVVYTDSDYPYGHGLLVYSPYNDYRNYAHGRYSLFNIGYDQKIIDFYDRFMSRRLAHEGEEMISQYGGKWYISGFEQEAEAATDAVESEDTVGTDAPDDVAPGTSQESEGGKKYSLETEKTENGYYATALSKESWDIIDYIEIELMFESKSGDANIYLGNDYCYQKDSKNRLALVNPSEWIGVGSSIVPFYSRDRYIDSSTGEQAKIGVVPAFVNDHEAYLYVYYDDEHPRGLIQGYRFCDISTGDEDSNGYYLEENDKVDMILEYFDNEGNWKYKRYGKPCDAKDLSLTRYSNPFDSRKTYGRYIVHDIYGNTYTTDVRLLGKTTDIK